MLFVLIAIYNFGNPAEIIFTEEHGLGLSFNLFSIVDGRDTTVQVGSFLALISEAVGIRRNVLYTGEPFIPMGFRYLKRDGDQVKGVSFGYSRITNNSGDTITSSSGMVYYGVNSGMAKGIKLGYLKSSNIPFLGSTDIVPYINVGLLTNGLVKYGGNILYFAGTTVFPRSDFNAIQLNFQAQNKNISGCLGLGKLTGNGRGYSYSDDEFNFISKGRITFSGFFVGEGLLIIKEFYTEDWFGTYNQNSTIVDINLFTGLNIQSVKLRADLVYQGHRSDADLAAYTFDMSTGGLGFTLSGRFSKVFSSLGLLYLNIDPDKNTADDEFARLNAKLLLRILSGSFDVNIGVYGRSDRGTNVNINAGGIEMGLNLKNL